ncbi:ABC transporter permease subunit [Acidothermaceae bacterium B102]|nr:ABC transporter permease subunit [Acidothermaceae bacterium B102]
MSRDPPYQRKVFVVASISTAQPDLDHPSEDDLDPGGGEGGFTAGAVVRYVLLAVVIAIGVLGLVKCVGQKEWTGLAVVVVATLVVVATYVTPKFIPLKYLVPGILLMIMFQLYPVLYTFETAFTNNGDGHRSSKAASIAAITVNGPVVQGANATSYTLSVAVKAGANPLTAPFVYFLVDTNNKVQLGDSSGLHPVAAGSVTVSSLLTKVTAAKGYTILSALQVNARSDEFNAFTVPAGNGSAVKESGISSAYLGQSRYVYNKSSDTITDSVTKTVYVAKDAQWTPQSGNGAPLAQGWQQNVGFSNFTKVLTNSTIRSSFTGILFWNLAFAFFSTLTIFALGLLLAIALNDSRMKGQKVTRSLLLIPYALPAFVTALVWASMYNKDFGLINSLTGLHIDWLGSVWPARAALLITNLWLGFPYMFIVCTGALQSVPGDLKEAATVDGASPLFAFRTVILPMLMVAVAPLLVATFAFNFNNFTLIQLLTGGGPFPANNPSAGKTDLLISYTYRLAFGGGGAQFGFAAAISIFIFIIVAIISLATFSRTKALEDVN